LFHTLETTLIFAEKNYNF